MNILFTCAGRRNYLIAYFRTALRGTGRLVAADCSAYATALQEADEAVIVPRVDDPGYIDELLSLCVKKQISLLVPLNDHELPLLAREQKRFAAMGTRVLVSSPEVVELAADKLATARFAERIGLLAPKTYLSLEAALKALESHEVQFPLIIKPRWGSASLGVERVEDRETLELAWRWSQHRFPALGLRQASSTGSGLIIQSMLPGQEYGLDVVNDLSGYYRTTFVKRKLAMRSGETERAITESNPLLKAVGERLGQALGHIGNLDCDLFFDGQQAYLLELNPRFGGGYPFSAEAGADVPAALIAWAQGREPASRWWDLRAGVCAAKCDRLVDVAQINRPADVVHLRDPVVELYLPVAVGMSH
ncbi:ATP-grasp domain-containing protein [Halomonas marinisediminis]|uniref:ATP-grasp domain-containing protein n=1 Tax=Halomonas marinisediminis TaxID=2546095 RepID=A0ABY2D774_9GAMM|nr:ATP-grasp domain-containing protein [Halomonas marinisediminis]TDB02894.1 ATP-grasp domain-containing protein [Halomonas marinisediminis]